MNKTTGSVRNLAAIIAVMISLFVFTRFISKRYHAARLTLAGEHYARGQKDLKNGRLDQAREEYRKALIFSPDNQDVRLELASMLMTSDTDEAQNYLHELADDDPTSGPVNLMLARLDVNRHDVNAAVSYYHRSIYGLWPSGELRERINARWELIDVLRQHGRSQDAVPELLSLSSDAPDDPALKRRIADTFVSLGEQQNAKTLYRQLVGRNPHDAGAMTALAFCYLRNGELADAAGSFHRAVQLDPKDMELRKNLKEVQSVVELDPRRSSLSRSQRSERSRRLFNSVAGIIGSCQKAPADPAATMLLQVIRLQQSQPDSKQNTDNDVASAQQLWAKCPDTCRSSSAFTLSLSALLRSLAG